MDTYTPSGSGGDRKQTSINLEKARVYEIMAHIVCRILIVGVTFGTYILILAWLFLQNQKSLGVIGATPLGPVMLAIVRYYFGKHQQLMVERKEERETEVDQHR